MGFIVELFLKRGLLMPHSIPRPLRQVMRQRSEQGQSVTAIAAALGLIPRTVRHLLRRFRMGGQDAVAPSYASHPQTSALATRDCEEEVLRNPSWRAPTSG